jgi:hypothetical protein
MFTALLQESDNLQHEEIELLRATYCAPNEFESLAPSAADTSLLNCLINLPIQLPHQLQLQPAILHINVTMPTLYSLQVLPELHCA